MNDQLPKLISRFLRWICDPKLLQYIEGELFEFYKENERDKPLIRKMTLSGKCPVIFECEG